MFSIQLLTMERVTQRVSKTTNNFSSINECTVDDITLEFFYKPHTVTLLILSIAAILYTAFVR